MAMPLTVGAISLLAGIAAVSTARRRRSEHLASPA
jgi:hypothetical protein